MLVFDIDGINEVSQILSMEKRDVEAAINMVHSVKKGGERLSRASHMLNEGSDSLGKIIKELINATGLLEQIEHDNAWVLHLQGMVGHESLDSIFEVDRDKLIPKTNEYGIPDYSEASRVRDRLLLASCAKFGYHAEPTANGFSIMDSDGNKVDPYKLVNQLKEYLHDNYRS